jgi:Na+/alanine symporter
MAIPNLIGLILLGGVIKYVTNDYLKRWDEGKITSPFGD